jgi:hypothetical protein
VCPLYTDVSSPLSFGSVYKPSPNLEMHLFSRTVTGLEDARSDLRSEKLSRFRTNATASPKDDKKSS